VFSSPQPGLELVPVGTKRNVLETHGEQKGPPSKSLPSGYHLHPAFNLFYVSLTASHETPPLSAGCLLGATVPCFRKYLAPLGEKGNG